MLRAGNTLKKMFDILQLLNLEIYVHEYIAL
jgi:hypothetical protein